MITKQKGTQDILPGESIKWSTIEDKLRLICKIYGYNEIRTPIFEASELYHRSVGEGSDLVRKETYDFIDRGGRNVTLRPEGTAGAVRSFIENKMYAENQINKLFYIGSMFRYERPQKGRLREFHQFGVEAFGSKDPIMDADVIMLAVTIIKAFGLKGIKVRINSLGDEESRNNYKEALIKHFSSHIDELCNDCKDRLVKNPLRILDCKVDRETNAYKTAPKIEEYLNEESKNYFNSVLKYLDNAGVEYVIDNNLVRGLDYYSHTIFEVEAQIEGFGAQNVLCGGGRYDKLVESLDGPSMPAVGFAFGLERFLMALEAEGKVVDQPNKAHLYIMPLGEEAKIKCLKLANEARFNGLITEIDYLNKSMKNQFKQAERCGATYIAIMGSEEIENNEINVKNVKTQKQEKVNVDDMIEYIINDINSQRRCSGHCSSCGGDCEE